MCHRKHSLGLFMMVLFTILMSVLNSSIFHRELFSRAAKRGSAVFLLLLQYARGESWDVFCLCSFCRAAMMEICRHSLHCFINDLGAQVCTTLQRSLIQQKTKKWHISCWCFLVCEHWVGYFCLLFI